MKLIFSSSSDFCFFILTLFISPSPSSNKVPIFNAFILLSDESLSTIKAYDVWKEKKLYGKAYMGIKRTTYVIDENGTIIYADDKVVAKSDAEKVLCFLKK